VDRGDGGLSSVGRGEMRRWRALYARAEVEVDFEAHLVI